MDKRNPYIIDVSGLELQNFIVEEPERDAAHKPPAAQDTTAYHNENSGYQQPSYPPYPDSDYIKEMNSDDQLSNEDYPFEYSKTKPWTESFFETEENSNALASLLIEISEIKQLVLEIRELMPRTMKPRQ